MSIDGKVNFSTGLGLRALRLPSGGPFQGTGTVRVFLVRVVVVGRQRKKELPVPVLVVWWLCLPWLGNWLVGDAQLGCILAAQPPCGVRLGDLVFGQRLSLLPCHFYTFIDGR